MANFQRPKIVLRHLEAYKPKKGRETDLKILAKNLRKGAGPPDDCVADGPMYAVYQPDDFTVGSRKT